jgi:uncharacterized repeat protein (TIGR01451 family)
LIGQSTWTSSILHVRLDSFGNKLWALELPILDTTIEIAGSSRFLKVNNNSGFVGLAAATSGRHVFYKIDNQGNVIWQKFENIGLYPNIKEFSGGKLGVFSSVGSSAPNTFYCFNENGDSLSQFNLPNDTLTYLDYVADTDTSFAFLCHTQHTQDNFFILRVSETGVDLGTFGHFLAYKQSDQTALIQLPNGQWQIAAMTPNPANGYFQLTVAKWALDLQSISVNNYPLTFFEQTPGGMFFDPFGNLIFYGKDKKPLGQPCSSGYGCHNSFVWKLDSNGDVLWKRVFGGNTMAAVVANHATSLPNGGYGLCGQLDGAIYCAQTNGEGNLYGNDLKVHFFKDDNANCVIESPEAPLWAAIAKATRDDGLVFIQSADSSGNATLNLPTGNYHIDLLPPAGNLGLWDICPFTDSVQFSNQMQVHDLDSVGFAPVVDCPVLQVEMGGGLFRPCTSIGFYVKYCNLGTQTAENASVQLSMHPFFSYESSTIPLLSQTGNDYNFSIGNIAPGQCGSFFAQFLLSCDAQMGQALCASAHIFPDTLCLPPPANWDRSDLEVSADCIGDSVKFTVTNKGVGNMNAATEFIIIEDHVLLRQGNIQLPAGIDTILYIPMPSQPTYYMQAKQRPGHPNSLFAGAGADFCGATGQSTLLDFPIGGSAYFTSVHCDEVRTSFDPNDKRGFPLGFGTEHIIGRNQDLEYMIRFQNTGNDTAFTIVVRDTLPTTLDWASLRVGSSSHANTWQLSENGILSFRFDHILLTDSTTNEPASHGFVKFKIQQQANLDWGTIIENRAGIYFDYNLPVLTDWSRHRIDTIIFLVKAIEPKLDEGHASFLSFSPNPVQPNAYLYFKNTHLNGSDFRLFDIFGEEKMRQRITLNRVLLPDSLISGFYLFTVDSKQALVGKGKVLVH